MPKSVRTTAPDESIKMFSGLMSVHTCQLASMKPPAWATFVSDIILVDISQSLRKTDEVAAQAVHLCWQSQPHRPVVMIHCRNRVPRGISGEPW